MITESDAKKFQELYKAETGKEISSAEALECARNLVEMVRLIYRPIKKGDYEKFISENVNCDEKISSAKI